MKIKNLILFVIGAAVILTSCGQNMNKNVKIETRLDTISYAIGVDMANMLDMNSIHEIEYDAFINGMIDAFEDRDLKMDENEIKPYINDYFRKLREERSTKNLEDGRVFMEENEKKEGIIVTESGLQYEILREGTGKSPKATDMVRCHYEGTLIDGTVFDSSYEKGDTAEFSLSRVIPGWTEGIQLMKEGAKYKFYIPSELAYGQRVPRGGKIEPNMALIFEVELFEVILVGQKKVN